MISVGAARRVITPDGPVMLQGYGSRDRLSDGVSGDILAGCLAIRDSHSTLLILTYDMIGIQIEDARKLRAEVSSAAGVPSGNIMIACSHTHFAPAISPTVITAPRFGLVEPEPGFTDAVARVSIEAATEALRSSESAELSTYRTPVPSVVFNRRAVAGDGSVKTSFLYPPEEEDLRINPVDTELSVLRFDSVSGRRIYLLNFGCHPVTGGAGDEDFYRISPDYIGALRATMEDHAGCEVFFSLGSAGDAVPMNRRGRCREQIGETLAYAALLGERAYRRDPVAAGLASVSHRVELESGYPPDEEGPDRYEDLRSQLITAEGADPALTKRFEDALHRKFRRRLYPEGRCAIEIQCMRIGETALVALPFEVLSAFSMKMKERFPTAVLISCANGYEGYLPSLSDIERGGYEAEPRSFHFTPGAEERISVLVEGILADF